VRSRFANFFKLDEAGSAGALAPVSVGAGPGAPGAQALPGTPPGEPAGSSSANAGSMLLAMLKKQLPGGAVAPGAPAAPQQAAGPTASGDLDDVTQVAMSAALQVRRGAPVTCSRGTLRCGAMTRRRKHQVPSATTKATKSVLDLLPTKMWRPDTRTRSCMLLLK
jgi:hypothetical protein